MNIIDMRKELMHGKTIFDMTLRVGYYARVSTDKNDQLNSLENQMNFFREMILENNNWVLVGEYIDEGISGTSIKNRNNFLKMIDDSKLGKIDLIITKEISRFSRNVVDSIQYTEDLLSHGTIVYFLSDNINTLYPDSEFRLALMSSLAQDEVRRLSERVKFGVQRMIKDGKIIGNHLTGYYKEDGKYKVDYQKKEMIDMVFHLYITGFSFDDIAFLLYKSGFKNKKDELYSTTTLKKILTNPRYKGFYTANLTKIESYKTHRKIKVPKEEQILYKTAKIEPIISDNIWDYANMIYQNKCRVGNKTNYYHKLCCINHKESFVRLASYQRKKNPVLVCKTYKEKGVIACESPIIQEKVFSQFMAENVLPLICPSLDVIKKEAIEMYKMILSRCKKNQKDKCVAKIFMIQNQINHFFNSINSEKLINILIDKIIVTKLDNRYNMNLKVIVGDLFIKDFTFEN